MERRDAAGIERHLLARLIADPQDDRVAAQVQNQSKGSSVARRGRKSLQTVRPRLERDMPSVVGPRCVTDADLAEHLRSQMQHRKRIMVDLRIEPGPVAHAGSNSTRLCNLRSGAAKAAPWRQTRT